MDWMYKEHAKNEESLPDEQNHCFQHSSINHDDTLSRVNPSNEKNSMQQIPSKVEAEYSEESSVLGPALSSEHITAEPDALKPSNEGDVSEFLSYSSDMPFEKVGALDKPESMNVGLPVKRYAEEECKGTDNKDEVIKKLREEVSFQVLLFSSFLIFCFPCPFLVSFPLPRKRGMLRSRKIQNHPCCLHFAYFTSLQDES